MVKRERIMRCIKFKNIYVLLKEDADCEEFIQELKQLIVKYGYKGIIMVRTRLTTVENKMAILKIKRWEKRNERGKLY